jgi:ankyrin repeat protein
MYVLLRDPAQESGTDCNVLVQTLLTAGADLKAKTVRGHSALFLAAVKDRPDICTLLLLRGESPNTRSASGRTVLYHAAAKGHETVVRTLVSRGAKVNLADCNGRTPLYAAARAGRVQCVKALLELGATRDIRPSDVRQTPLEAAAKHGQLSVMPLLVIDGVDPALLSRALQRARSSEHYDVVNFLRAAQNDGTHTRLGLDNMGSIDLRLPTASNEDLAGDMRLVGCKNTLASETGAE